VSLAETEELKKPGRRISRRGDRVFSGVVTAAGLVIVVALAGVALFLLYKGYPALTAAPAELPGGLGFWSFVWPLLFGTLLSSAIALVLGTPLAIGIALFVTFYSPRRLAGSIGFMIDLLAAVPSVVFGLWGANFLGPRLVPLYEWLAEHASWIPFFAGPASATGRTMMTAGIILAIMIVPIVTALSREVFQQAPHLQREAALALGATRWEMIRGVVLPFGRSGVVSHDARSRPRAGRDDGRRDGPVRLRRGDLQPHQPVQPLHDRSEHRAELPREHRVGRERTDRDRARAVRDHVRRELLRSGDRAARPERGVRR
jgi:phosphate transport system permease protein